MVTNSPLTPPSTALNAIARPLRPCRRIVDTMANIASQSRIVAFQLRYNGYSGLVPCHPLVVLVAGLIAKGYNPLAAAIVTYCRYIDRLHARQHTRRGQSVEAVAISETSKAA